MTLLKKFGWRHYSRIRSMRPLERTDVFIGCCVDHAAGHGERRPVPLLSHYLHVIPASIILKCTGATKITDFSNTSEIALEQLQKCSNAVQYASSIGGKLGVIHGDEMREAAADVTPPAFSVCGRLSRWRRFWLHVRTADRDSVAFLEDRTVRWCGTLRHPSHVFLLSLVFCHGESQIQAVWYWLLFLFGLPRNNCFWGGGIRNLEHAQSSTYGSYGNRVFGQSLINRPLGLTQPVGQLLLVIFLLRWA
jgi:hypothetical protein